MWSNKKTSPNKNWTNLLLENVALVDNLLFPPFSTPRLSNSFPQRTERIIAILINLSVYMMPLADFMSKSTVQEMSAPIWQEDVVSNTCSHILLFQCSLP